jgi:hypothetical protein
MPAPLQRVTAVATLVFDRDQEGRFGGFSLNSFEGDEADVGEHAGAALADTANLGGDLITYNGAHDLNVLRFAALRSQRLQGGGASDWLGPHASRHLDLMREVARDGRLPRLADVAAGLGFAPVWRTGAASAEHMVGRRKAEMDVLLTGLLYFHIQAERRNDRRVLGWALIDLGRYLARRAMAEPHLSAVLDAPIFSRLPGRQRQEQVSERICFAW